MASPITYELGIDPRIVEETPEQQGLLASLIAKIINNLQVTIKNIHVRYEDKLSVPGVRVADFLRLLESNWTIAPIRGRLDIGRVLCFLCG